MAASDHLNQPLFHGTGHFFAKGEIVDPKKGEIKGVKRAFASPDLAHARRYASLKAQKSGMLFAPVYSVSPVDENENLDEFEWKESGILSSTKGFKPEKIVDWGMNDPYGRG